MQPALSGSRCRGAANQKLIARALGHLTLTTSIPPSRHRTASPSGWTCLSCRITSQIRARPSSSSSNSQWKARQSRDHFARTAKVQGLKSRAAYKLLEDPLLDMLTRRRIQMDSKYHLFKRNQTVVDLGYAPGSWSQVAVERTKPHGVVVGIDLIPAQPPRGMTSIQGDFLSPQVRRLVRDVLVEQVRRKEKERVADRRSGGVLDGAGSSGAGEREQAEGGGGGDEAVVIEDRPSYIDLEKQASHDIEAAEADAEAEGRMADVVISDMCEPWPQTTGFMSNTLSRPHRLMNTSGINFRDHALSMTNETKKDLCYAALEFASENLKAGGHFVCKFYQGAEDAVLQTKLRKLFDVVKREKPDSSRKDSKEAYLVALRRKGNATLAGIEGR